jgi:hypothetical protein
MSLMLPHAADVYIPVAQVVEHGVQTALFLKYPLLHTQEQFVVPDAI